MNLPGFKGPVAEAVRETDKKITIEVMTTEPLLKCFLCSSLLPWRNGLNGD